MRRFAIISIALAARAAAADPPPLDHVITAPTAWLPAAGAVVGSAALDQHGNSSIVVGYGLGGIAEVELDGDGDLHACGGTSCNEPLYQARAAFRVGARQDEWFDGQPALVFGVQESLPGTRRVGDAYVVASRTLGTGFGSWHLHAGAIALDATADDGTRLGFTVRPIGGIELVPAQYPKTTMMLDATWLSELYASGPNAPVHAAWLGGFGVRYQALSWGSIELAIRASTDENRGVVVRINGVLGQ